MVEFTPISFSTGKHLLTEQTAERRKKATSCVCRTTRVANNRLKSNQRIISNMGIKLKPLLLKPFNSLTPLPASHLKDVSSYSQQQKESSAGLLTKAALLVASILLVPIKRSQSGAQEELELFPDAFPLVPLPQHTSRRAACSNPHPLLSSGTSTHPPGALQGQQSSWQCSTCGCCAVRQPRNSLSRGNPHPHMQFLFRE